MGKTIVTIGSHFIRFDNLSDKVRAILKDYTKRNLVGFQLRKEMGRWVRELGKVFAYIAHDKSYIVFHISLKDDILLLLKNAGVQDSDLEINEMDFDDYHPAPSSFKVKESFVPYDYQEPLIDYTLKEGTRKIINLSMGLGKTTVVLKVAEKLGCRFAVTVLPRYKDKWVNDIVNYGVDMGSNKKKDPLNRYLVLDSVDSLINYLELMEEDPHHDEEYIDCIIITITTLIGYIQYYNECDDIVKDKLVHPIDIWHVMRIGFKFVDEAHDHFHRNVMIDLHSHIPKTCYLSATLNPSDPFLKKMYQMMYPVADRMGGNIYTPYIQTYAYHYGHQNIDKWRFMLQGRYSHSQYERNFSGKTPYALKRRQSYFEMLKGIVKDLYLDMVKPTQKAILFFSTVHMCDLFVEYLKKHIKDKDIRRYVYEDDYENIVEADIIVSTPGSAGTAIDIPGLILVVLTISVNSEQMNLQIMGRNRELKKFPGQFPSFAYLVADDIDASVRYHLQKQTYIIPKSKSFNEVYTNRRIE